MSECIYGIPFDGLLKYRLGLCLAHCTLSWAAAPRPPKALKSHECIFIKHVFGFKQQVFRVENRRQLQQTQKQKAIFVQK